MINIHVLQETIENTGVSTYEQPIAVEIDEQPDTIHKLTSDYNSFMEDTKNNSDEIEDIIDIKSIDDITQLIEKFEKRLNVSANKKERSKIAETTDLTLKKFSNIPLLGSLLEGEIKKADQRIEDNLSSRQILKEMFDGFKEKSIVLEKTYEKADKLRAVLITKEKSLIVYSERVKKLVEKENNNFDRIKAISLGGMIESHKLKNKEKIYNKLDFIMQFIEEQLTTIALMMPSIETGLVEDNEISNFLSSVNDMNKMFKSITDLSNTVALKSNQNIMNLITEVSESMTNVVDVNHMEKLASTNQTFMKKLSEGTAKKIKQDAETYKKLIEIGSDLDQATLTYNQVNTKMLKNTLNIKDIT